jgi:hypothetical protein
LFQHEVIGANNREEAAERFLSGIVNAMFEKITVKAVRSDGDQTLGQVHSGLKQVQSRMVPVIRGLAQQLANQPAAPLR